MGKGGLPLEGREELKPDWKYLLTPGRGLLYPRIVPTPTRVGHPETPEPMSLDMSYHERAHKQWQFGTKPKFFVLR